MFRWVLVNIDFKSAPLKTGGALRAVYEAPIYISRGRHFSWLGWPLCMARLIRTKNGRNTVKGFLSSRFQTVFICSIASLHEASWRSCAFPVKVVDVGFPQLIGSVNKVGCQVQERYCSRISGMNVQNFCFRSQDWTGWYFRYSLHGPKAGGFQITLNLLSIP